MAKKSRRERRQETAKPKPVINGVEPVQVRAPEAPKPEPIAPPPQPAPRKVINFAQEYLYVYIELRNIFIVTLIMFIIMAGLGYFI